MLKTCFFTIALFSLLSMAYAQEGKYNFKTDTIPFLRCRYGNSFQNQFGQEITMKRSDLLMNDSLSVNIKGLRIAKFDYLVIQMGGDCFGTVSGNSFKGFRDCMDFEMTTGLEIDHIMLMDAQGRSFEPTIRKMKIRIVDRTN